MVNAWMSKEGQDNDCVNDIKLLSPMNLYVSTGMNEWILCDFNCVSIYSCNLHCVCKINKWKHNCNDKRSKKSLQVNKSLSLPTVFPLLDKKSTKRTSLSDDVSLSNNPQTTLTSDRKTQIDNEPFHWLFPSLFFHLTLLFIVYFLINRAGSF